MPSFRCPFCHTLMSLNDESYKSFCLKFDDDGHSMDPQLIIEIYRCANETCKKETVIARGIHGYIENKEIRVYPEGADPMRLPDFIPLAIRNDYLEACIILYKSPKSAATLARRCLQGMIRDFWGIKKGRLLDEVEWLKEKVPATQWKAIDAVRHIGNIGAHMEKDVNIIVDVEPEEAEQLLKLIGLLIRKWYIARHDEEELYKSVSEIADKKKLAKKS